MNSMRKSSILILGVLVAVGLLICNIGHAIPNTGKSLETVEIESLQLAKDIVQSMDNTHPIDKQKVKVYNDADQLIYEARNSQDEKLVQLLKKSDFLTEINEVSYYKLSR